MRLDLGAAYQAAGDHGAAIQQLAQVVKVMPLNARLYMGSWHRLSSSSRLAAWARTSWGLPRIIPNSVGAEMITRALSQLEAPVPVPKPEMMVEEAMEKRRKEPPRPRRRQVVGSQAPALLFRTHGVDSCRIRGPCGARSDFSL